MDASSDFTGAALSFDISGEGVTIDPATGRLSIATDRLLAGITVTVTATNAAGEATSRFRLTVAAIELVPTLLAAPSLAGTGVIGAPVTVDPGQWDGVPAPTLALQWLIDGVAIPGAVAASYVPQPSDDTRALTCRVTASNPAGTAEAVTPPVAVHRAAPVATGLLPDLVLDAGAAPGTVAAAAAFTGAALTFAVNGRGATIDSGTGLVTIATGAIFDDERITVTASNSGGSATSEFRVSVRATLPVLVTAPALAGSGRIGAPVTVTSGAWGGLPAPTLALQWLSAGAAIPGATTATYVPGPAQDLKPLTCRVTASNAAGSAAAVTAALAVTRVPPTAVAALPDVSAEQGSVLAVEAAAAFAGAALSFSVAGGGATIDAATGRVLVPTAAEGAATVTVTATNSGGSASAGFRATVTKKPPVFIAPLLVAAPLVVGPAKIGKALTLQGGSWSGIPDPVVSRQWLRGAADIPGATGASYTPVPADDGKVLCCRVTATNPAGSAVTVTAGLTATYVAPVAKGGLLEEIFDVGSGPQTVAAAPDFTGANLSFAVTGAGATINPATGVVSIPTDHPVSGLVTVTATNSGGSASSAFQVTVESEDIPFALEAEDIEIVASVWRPAAQEGWFTPLLRFPGLAGETVDAIEWTTGKGPVTDSQFEVATWTGNAYQLYMRDAAHNLPGAVPRVDFSVWKADEARRNDLRFRWRRTAEGPWSAPSPQVSVPAPTARWLPLIHRSKEQFEQKIVGGGGFQFFRSWGYSPAKPDRLFGVMDIDIPIRTQDFGNWWESAPSVGLKVGISGQGCAIDSQDGDRILVMYSAASRRFLPGWNAKAGIYLSTDGGDSFALVQQLDDISGSAENTNGDQPGSRFMQFPFVEVPGGTPATRKWYAFQRRVPKGEPAKDGALWKSSNGGQTWAKAGETLTVAKFGNKLYVMRRATNGDFYFGTSTGLFRSTDEGGSWSKLAGLPAGGVLEIDVKGPAGEVWAAVDGAGLYRSTNHGASWTARKTGYDMQTFAISPHNRTRILIAGQNTPQRMTPQYSLNGGGSWSDIDTLPFPGQPEAFQSLIHGSHAYFIFHATDPNLVFAARYQHFGKSTDGGKTFVWASNNFDYNFVHAIAVDPGDWTQMALTMTDRMLVFTQNGHEWVWDDAIDEAVKAEIETQAGYTGHTGAGRGALILRNGANRRIISGAGNGTKRVTIVHATSGDNPIGKCSVPNHNGKVSWCLLGANDAVDPSRGYIGRWRYELSASGVLTGPIDVTYEVVGVGSGAGVVFGVEKTGSEVIRRSTNYGATWSVWATAPEAFRPIDSEPVLVTDSSQAARLLMVTASGKAYLIEGAAAPTTRLVFNLQAQIGPGYPAYELYHCAFDPHDPNVAYITANIYGGGSVFRTLDLLAATPTWTDISGNGLRQPRKIYVHPATGEVITSQHHGSMIFPSPEGYRATFGITTSLYDRVGAYPGIRR